MTIAAPSANMVESTLTAAFTRGTSTVLAVTDGSIFPSPTPLKHALMIRDTYDFTITTKWCLVKYVSRAANNLTMSAADDYALAVNLGGGAEVDEVFPIGSYVSLVDAADEIAQLFSEQADKIDADGSIPLTADWAAGAYKITAQELKASGGPIELDYNPSGISANGLTLAFDPSTPSSATEYYKVIALDSDFHVANGQTNGGYILGAEVKMLGPAAHAGTLNKLIGFDFKCGINGGAGVITELTGLRLRNYWVTGTVTTAYGLYIDTPSAGGTIGTEYAIYAADDADSYLAGDFDIGGTASAGVKAFKIDHPLDPYNKILYHGSIESPRYDLIYRGVVNLKAGKATVHIDAASNMTTGTFAELCQNAVVTSLQNQNGFARCRPGQIVDGVFDIARMSSLKNLSRGWLWQKEKTHL